MLVMHVKRAVVGIVLTSVAVVQGDLCGQGSTNVGGNVYCQAVKAIRYDKVGAAGSYKDIVNMAPDGTCTSQPKQFSGALSPLDEELSLHFRGPIHLKQIAVYNLSTTVPGKRSASIAQRRHQHHLFHKTREPAEVVDGDKEKRQYVTATIDGKVVSWLNNYSGTPVAPAASQNPVIVTATINGQVVSWTNNWFGPSTPPSTTPASPAALSATRQASTSILSTSRQTSYTTFTRTATTTAVPSAQPAGAYSVPVPQVAPPPAPIPVAPASLSLAPAPAENAKPEQPHATPSSQPAAGNSGSGVYQRIGYYNSATQTLKNLVFLGNYGGESGSSGVFDFHYGASLAYTGTDGCHGATSPQILSDKVIPSDKEIIVMLGEKCAENSACGYTRPGTVAHHGFAGADKLFLMEFSMPADGTSGFNGDMPAVWLLNAKIPRTLQYGNPECSCWKSGCGEFDVAEALHSGSKFLKSTLHTNKPTGDSDYIMRPTDKPLKLAVIFKSANAGIQIEVLPDSTEFKTRLTTDEIDTLCNSINEKAVSHV